MEPIHAILGVGSLVLAWCSLALSIARFTRLRVQIEALLRPTLLLWCVLSCSLALAWLAEVFIALYGASEHEGIAFQSGDGRLMTKSDALRGYALTAISLAAPLLLLLRTIQSKRWLTCLAVATCLLLRFL
jgi:hypothetical protein